MASYAEQMLEAIETGKFDEAEQLFQQALGKDDDDTVYSLAEELYGLGFSEQAKRAYQHLLTKYPQEDQLRTALAELAIDEGNNDEAAEWLGSITKDSTAYLEALLVLADLYQTDGLYEVAEAKLLEAYALAPDEPIIQFALAEYYFASGKYREAIPYYKGLLQVGERRFSGVDVGSRIGVAYALVGNVKNALGYLEQIDTLDMTPDVKFQLGLTYAADEETYDKGIETFEDLAEQDPSYATLYGPLGALYEAKQNDEEALRTYQRGLAVDQFNPKLYERAAIVSQRLGDEAQAGQYFEKGLAHNLGELVLVLDYSDWLVAQEKYAENISLLNDYLADEEADIDPVMYANLAKSYTALEDFEMAEKYWQAALPSFLDDASFLKEAYYFFREAGRRDLALETAHRYVELEPEDFDMVAALEELHAQEADDLY